ncbi:Fic family protein [Cnuibacter physcomitrellae]|uniref:Fic family protein n=1 Tax=Cnuibacter physcomitrellae TaxID=1619308 RepID=UPI0019BE3B13|nr:Fic family protein [Cnuibacter physcomitrellae]GGI39210.1 Fic family protein [Cnuibacter physcomitrellae]
MATDLEVSEVQDVPVPALEYETHHWRPQHPALFSRAEVTRQTGDYRSAVPQRIAAWVPALPADLTADVVDASAALMSFDAHTVSALGAEDPTLGPMASILLRTESASSSQIEQLTVSARQLALAELDQSERTNARAVVGNVRAMEAALRLSDVLDAASILAMQRELLLAQPGYEEHAGVFRDELVWIGNRDTAGPRGAEFIAPQHPLIGPAIEDMLDFAARDDLPALVQIAVAHAQFETIHPFVDGNGRTGRALAQAMLRSKGLAAHATVPLSAGLLTDAEGYFGDLQAYRAGDAGPIIHRFAAAARYAAATGRVLVDDLRRELELSRSQLEGLRSQAAAWRVLPTLIGQPVVNARYLQATLGLSEMTALRALTALTERGVLVERTGRARNRIWQHPGILDVLDSYAAAIRRAAIRPGR